MTRHYDAPRIIPGQFILEQSSSIYGGTGLDQAEGAAIVPAAVSNFFAMADGKQSISVADGSQFAAIPNQIVVAHEGGRCDRGRGDGSTIQTQQAQFTTGSH